MMTIEERILKKLSEALNPVHLEVVNESSSHNVPAGSETHFKVFVVSEAFSTLSRIARQRRVNEILKEELASGVHALTQRCLTLAEWETSGAESFRSPACLGGAAQDQAAEDEPT